MLRIRTTVNQQYSTWIFRSTLMHPPVMNLPNRIWSVSIKYWSTPVWAKKTEGKRYIVCYEYTSYVSGICVVLENPRYFTIYNIDRTSYQIHYEFDVPMNCQAFSWAFNSLPEEAKNHSRRKKPQDYIQLWSPMTVVDKNSQPIYAINFGLEEYDDSKFKDRLYKLTPVLWWLTWPISFHKFLPTPPELIFEGGSQSFRDSPEFKNLPKWTEINYTK